MIKFACNMRYSNRWQSLQMGKQRNDILRTLMNLGFVLLFRAYANTKIVRVGKHFAAAFTIVDSNARVTRSCIGNFTDVSLKECVNNCISNNLCQTFNYQHDEKICEILRASKFDGVGYIEYQKGWTHYETDCNEKKIGQFCKESNLCKDYEVCEETFNRTRFVCRCAVDFSGSKCLKYIGKGSNDKNPAPSCALLFQKYDSLADGYYWLKKSNKMKLVYCRRKGDWRIHKWSAWNECVYPGYRNRTRGCHDPRAKKGTNGLCQDEVENGTCSLPSSCQEIKETNKTAKNGLYLINLLNPVNVYCDMETVEGGWMLVTNITVDINLNVDQASKLLSSDRYTKDIAELGKAAYDNFFFDMYHLKEFNTTFNQIRFYCYKKNVGRTVHLYTTKEALGRSAFDYFINPAAARPKGCGSYQTFSDDNSYLAEHCHKWNQKTWGFWSSEKKRPFFITEPPKHNFMLQNNRFECDDDDKDTDVGVWKVFVR